MTEQQHADELRGLVEGRRFAMFTTVGADGVLVSRPMTIQEFDGWVVRFIAQDDNDVTRQSDGRQVNLAVMDGSTYVSLSGTGRVERGVAEKRALWDRLTEAYAGRPEDPDNIVLEVHVSSGEYWTGGNPLTRVLGLAKAAVTGERPDSGDHGAVQV